MNAQKKKGSATDIDAHVGRRLRSKRTLLGISQEKLAETIGLTFQQVQKYERGTNRISASRLFDISHALNVPVSYFFEQILEKPPVKSLVTGVLSDNAQEGFAGPTTHSLRDKETEELITLYYAIKNPEARKDIVDFIKSMAGRLSKTS